MFRAGYDHKSSAQSLSHVVICKILFKYKISEVVGKMVKALMDLVTLRAIAMKSTS